MRTVFVAGVLLASLMALAVPASATCVNNGPSDQVCANANVGTPTFGDGGSFCVDKLCPSVDSNSDLCIYWVKNGQLVMWVGC